MKALKTKRYFHEELDRLQALLMKMAGLAEDLVERAVDAFLERDGSVLPVIKEGDKRIDALELDLDDTAVALLALHQPVASDLRQVLTTLRIANDIERIGDHGHNIAKAARRLAENRPLREIPELAELASLSKRMLRDALAALSSRDSARARAVCARDDRVDDMRAAVQKILVSVMRQEPNSIAAALEYIRAAQQLERIGDLSTNISEGVVFLVEGRSIKHHAEERP